MHPTTKETDEIREQVFFLCNYGRGYTDQEVLSLPITERHWRVKRLNEKLKAEIEAQQRALKESKSRGRGRR